MPKGLRKPVFGVGINDYPGTSSWMIDGIRYKCPLYVKWLSMLGRCYNEKFVKDFPTYQDCNVCEEWKFYSNFRSWMLEQDWKGKELDKDLLVKNNKVYSAETCVFISRELNAFLNDHGARRGQWPLGVTWNKARRKFVAACSDPVTGKSKHIGMFETSEEAHLAWKAQKHQHALRYAEQQTDERIAEALRTRYL